MNFLKRAVLLFKIGKNADDKSLRKIAEEVSIPKSSVHRQINSRKKRVKKMGHDFFETQLGIEWLCRLIFGAILIFGIQAGVGSETISLFFQIIFISVYVGTSANSIRKIKNEMRTVISEYGDTQMEEIIKRCKHTELHLGGDESYFSNRLFLVLMEIKSGFILSEELEQNRTFDTWWKCVGGFLNKCKKILSFISDGGQALKKIGEKIKCKNVMDLFHLQQDIRTLFATKFHSKKVSLLSQMKKLNDEQSLPEAEKIDAINTINKKIHLLERGQNNYRNALFAASTQTHPFKDDLNIKTSAELKEQLHQEVNVLKTTLEECEIIDKKKLLNRVEKRIEPLANLNDLWLGWVEQAILCKTNNSSITLWFYKALAVSYFEEQLRKSKKKKWLRAHYTMMLDKAKSHLADDLLTEKYLTQEWIDFAKAMALKYQRTTSAIEGRNSRLSQHYFSARGIKANHVKPLTIIANFLNKRVDKTTAAERLCGYKPADLFEYILKNMNRVPLPRQRAKKTISALHQLLPDNI